ncbi:precorrin-6A reductase [Nocardia pseudobrasiliensis]|uniref:Precorrin-6A reductase n=1 Tax=Nocardia pseudobrasiliensis TaxID=45979 RepID=A0A370I8Q9_9NOCA|nr:precorrin-6A reductase [Nocardia pseudobrasiliensis]
MRVGGFGGVDGLREWLADNDVDVLVDATHPFAALISEHAAEAASSLAVPVIQLRRPGYRAQSGDHWTRVPDLATAAETAAALGVRIFLTIGRQGVGAFAGAARPWFLIRAIDPPTGPLPPNHEILLARGPFAFDDERRLLAERRIDVLVTKDSGGPTTAKLSAARDLNIPVVLVDRPPLPAGASPVDSVAEVLERLRGLG